MTDTDLIALIDKVTQGRQALATLRTLLHSAEPPVRALDVADLTEPGPSQGTIQARVLAAVRALPANLVFEADELQKLLPDVRRMSLQSALSNLTYQRHIERIRLGWYRLRTECHK